MREIAEQLRWMADKLFDAALQYEHHPDRVDWPSLHEVYDEVSKAAEDIERIVREVIRRLTSEHIHATPKAGILKVSDRVITLSSVDGQLAGRRLRLSRHGLQCQLSADRLGQVGIDPRQRREGDHKSLGASRYTNSRL